MGWMLKLDEFEQYIIVAIAAWTNLRLQKSPLSSFFVFRSLETSRGSFKVTRIIRSFEVLALSKSQFLCQ